MAPSAVPYCEELALLPVNLINGKLFPYILSNMMKFEIFRESLCLSGSRSVSTRWPKTSWECDLQSVLHLTGQCDFQLSL